MSFRHFTVEFADCFLSVQQTFRALNSCEWTCCLYTRAQQRDFCSLRVSRVPVSNVGSEWLRVEFCNANCKYFVIGTRTLECFPSLRSSTAQCHADTITSFVLSPNINIKTRKVTPTIAVLKSKVRKVETYPCIVRICRKYILSKKKGLTHISADTLHMPGPTQEMENFWFLCSCLH